MKELNLLSTPTSANISSNWKSFVSILNKCMKTTYFFSFSQHKNCKFLLHIFPYQILDLVLGDPSQILSDLMLGLKSSCGMEQHRQ